MVYEVRDRKGNVVNIKESKTVRFLYGTFVGRCIVKLFSCSIFSKFMGWFLNRKISVFKINGFVKKNNIDLEMFEDKRYKSFNDFFTRRMKDECFNIDKNSDVLVSPSDAKLSVYDINENSVFKIKGSYYSVNDLLDNNNISKKYNGGKILIFRLEASDYHRYIYIDNGTHENNVFIKGMLNTVRPIALKYYNIYKQNSREYTVMHTDNFGDIIQVEVGALLVGKINNFHEYYNFKKGEEKGMFEFGGSTIVLLIEKNRVEIDKDILDNSNNNIETIVKIGDRIGKKL